MSAVCNFFPMFFLGEGAGLMLYNACRKACSCIYSRWIQLLLSWMIGIFAGFYFNYVCRPFSLSLMRSLIFQPVSIVGVFASVVLPFLFTYFAAITNRFIYVLFVCFLKAFSFAFTGASVSVAYLTADWMIRALLLFSDICTLPLLFYLWISACNDTLARIKFCLYILFSSVIASIDLCVVSPFLCGLL